MFLEIKKKCDANAVNPCNFNIVDLFPFSSNLHQKDAFPLSRDPITVAKGNTNSHLVALQKAFKNYHDKEMELLKKESFSWLRNKMKDFDVKISEMQKDFESFHTNKVAELLTEFSIKTACLMEQNSKENEMKNHLDDLADSCVSDALASSLSKEFEAYHTNDLSELHTDFVIKTACLMEENRKNNELEAKVDRLADSCVSTVLSNSLDEYMATNKKPTDPGNLVVHQENASPNDGMKTSPTRAANLDITGSLEDGFGNFNENDSPQELVKHIKTLESEIKQLHETIDSLNRKEKESNEISPDSSSSGVIIPKDSAIFNTGKTPGPRVRIQEDVDKNVLNQISIAKDDMGRQYQNLLNEVIMEYCKELEKVKAGVYSTLFMLKHFYL